MGSEFCEMMSRSNLELCREIDRLERINTAQYNDLHIGIKEKVFYMPKCFADEMTLFSMRYCYDKEEECKEAFRGQEPIKIKVVVYGERV